MLHVEPLHICDQPAATLKLLSPLSSFAPTFLSLPLSAPQIKSSTCHHTCTQASPLCSVYSLPVYILSPITQATNQWPASERRPCSPAAVPTWPWRRRAWNGAPTSAPESLALLHGRIRFSSRHGCLLWGLGSRAAAISLPDRITSWKTRPFSTNSKTRCSFKIFHRVNVGIYCFGPLHLQDVEVLRVLVQQLSAEARSWP